jgi:choline-sulfatase
VGRSFRYIVILVLFALGTGLAAVAGWRYARTSAPVSGPIILVSIDALRADHLPAYGYRGIHTPHIDALASDGVVFERAYAHVPLTLPAHAALLSGRLPIDTGVRDNVGFVIPDTERLIGALLTVRGYATGAVVSSYALRKATGIGQGFAFFDDDLASGTPAGLHAATRRDGADSERIAERWLSTAGTPRAFLFLHLNEPHAPDTPPTHFDQFSGSYDGAVAYADEIVGRLINYLKNQQLYDQATIILVADHGESLGAHGETQHGLFVYDDTLKVPLIIKQAAGEGAGRRVRDVVQQVDLVPTILDLVKAPVPGNLRGRSLKPLLEGGELPGRVVYSESLFARYQFGWSPLSSVSDGRYRYINAPAAELYDLEADPGSLANLVDAQPREAARLAAELKKIVAEPTSEARDPADPRSEYRDRLLALGFLGPHAGRPGPVDPDADPKTMVSVVEAYRAAMGEVAARRWPSALEQLRAIARGAPGVPGMSQVWAELAAVAERAGRYDTAVEAYRRVIAVEPEAVAGRMGLAGALLRARKLDEARQQAEQAAAVADVADTQPVVKAQARELLARIALASHDPGSARVQAQRVLEFDPASPVPAFVEGRLLYERGRYAEALSLLEQAQEEAAASRPQFLDLHYYRAEALLHLDRFAEAEEALTEELTAFPENSRAHIALATLYHTQGRTEDADAALNAMLDAMKTPEAYDTAIRLWTTFGDRARAATLKADVQRAFPRPGPSLAHE